MELDVDAGGNVLWHTCCYCRDLLRVRVVAAERSDPMFGRSMPCPQCVTSSDDTPQAFDAVRFRVPIVLEKATLASWKPDNASPVIKASNFTVTWPPARHILLLSGPPGRGKSHLAVAVMRAVWERHRKASRFWVVPELLSRIRATFDEETRFETASAIEDEMMRVPLLVLDDLGTEKSTEWAQEQLFKIVDRRYREALPLVVTTNLDAARLDARLVSRLSDRTYSTVVNIDGERYPDRRSVA